jgi:hypothetical protein
MNRTVALHTVAVLVALAASAPAATRAQTPTDTSALRADIERRFEVDRLRNGLALRPRDPSRAVRIVELTDGPVAVDGQPATGAELRDKLGTADADLVMQLSYLSAADRRALFGAPAVVEPTEPAVERRARRRARGAFESEKGDRVSIFSGDIEVAEGERVDGDAVAIGGSVRVNGDVRGEVVSVGGHITLGPHASVGKNVVVVGGTLRRDPQARVDGRVQQIGIGSFDWSRARWRDLNPMWLWWGSMLGSAVAFVGTLTRVAIMCLMAAIVILFGQKYVERAGDHVSTDALKAGAIGFLAQVLFIPVLVLLILLLVVTIIGIPLLILVPFLILGLMLVAFVGFTAVGHRVGLAVSTRFGWPVDNPYWTTVIGIVAVMLPLMLARLVNLGGLVLMPFGFGLGLIGVVVEYLAWTVGFGAVALARFSGGTFSIGSSMGSSGAATSVGPPAPSF